MLDARLRLPLRSRLVATAREFPTLVVATAAAPATREAALARSGVEVGAGRSGRAPAGVDLGAALRLLGARGVTRVFSEGGPRVGSRLIALGLADEVVLFTARQAARPARPAGARRRRPRRAR